MIAWIKKWWGAVFGGIAAILAFILLWKWKADHVDTLKDALVVAKAEKDIAVLVTKREAVMERVLVRREDLAQVDKKLEDNQRAIVEARTGAKELDKDGVLAAYRELGYLP